MSDAELIPQMQYGFVRGLLHGYAQIFTNRNCAEA